MKNLIIGTAGHIDHGKTALVKVLTGTDTDRLKEEKARGITIELGFANFDIPGCCHFGIVDVPGHERFVRTMVAGTGGIDIVMLVIAADDGIKPQTREHFEILRLLGTGNGIVVITKCDLVEKGWIELLAEEIGEYVSGSFLADSPIIPVSSKTGEGIDTLKQALASIAESINPKSRSEGAFRLPVDRAFTVPGFGTVVTGTAAAGRIRVGDEIEIMPAGIRTKARGIQIHGNRHDSATAGQRVALNLQGVSLQEVKRGDNVTSADSFRSTRISDVRLQVLESTKRALRHRSSARLHTGTFESTAQIILLEHDRLEPGETAYAQLRLEDAALLVSGDRFIIRGGTPATTLGGGIVLDPFPPRRKRRSADALQLLEALDSAEYRRSLQLVIEQSELSGISLDTLKSRTGYANARISSALESLEKDGIVARPLKSVPFYLSASSLSQLKGLVLREIEAHMAENHFRDSMKREELRSRFPQRSDPRFFPFVLEQLEKELLVETTREVVALSGPPGKVDPGGMCSKIRDIITSAGMEPPTIKELASATSSTEKEIRDQLSLLIREGSIIRISGELFYSTETLNRIRSLFVSALKEKNGITPPQFREVTGLSRKYLIPLLEFFDGEKLTLRLGDKRVLRGDRNR